MEGAPFHVFAGMHKFLFLNLRTHPPSYSRRKYGCALGINNRLLSNVDNLITIYYFFFLLKKQEKQAETPSDNSPAFLPSLVVQSEFPRSNSKTHAQVNAQPKYHSPNDASGDGLNEYLPIRDCGKCASFIFLKI